MATASGPTVKIYTTSWCSFCRAEKKFLNQHGVAYDALDVEADPKASAELANLSHQLGVPFTVIIKPDSSVATVLGFDRVRISTVLGISN